MPQDEKVQVIETPIETFNVEKKDFTNGIRLVYFSTPQRGLEILVPVFEKLAQEHNNIHLDVFSSFKIYGWEETDKQFEPLYDKIRSHPKMTYHGFAEQEVLRKHLTEAHILAYPNIWKETSCRVLMESMSAGLLCVHPNLAALADTSGGLNSMYQYHDDPSKHAKLFYNYLNHAVSIVNSDSSQNYLKFVKTYADSRFNITKISSQWEGLLNDLLQQYPTVESRSVPSKMFVYKT
jgi:glycosyltransferase involved in cell wall biosynthesis